LTTVDNEVSPPAPERSPPRADRGERRIDLERGASVKTVIGLTIVSGLLARGLAPALPGLAVGMEGSIAIAARIAAVLSMVAVAGALAASARLTAQTFADSSIDASFRFMAVPAGVCVGVLAVASIFQGLNPELSLVLALAATGPVLLAAPMALRLPQHRSAGLVLAMAGGAGLLHVLGRAIALHSAEEASVGGFRLAQGIETFATLIDVSSLGLIGTYLVRRASKRARWILGSSAVALLGLVVAASKGAQPDSAWWQVLAGRTLDQILRNPEPFLPRVLRYAIEAAGFLLAGLSLAAGGASSRIGTLFAACLVGRASADIPIPALILLLAGLLGPFPSATSKAVGAASGPQGS